MYIPSAQYWWINIIVWDSLTPLSLKQKVSLASYQLLLLHLFPSCPSFLLSLMCHELAVCQVQWVHVHLVLSSVNYSAVWGHSSMLEYILHVCGNMSSMPSTITKTKQHSVQWSFRLPTTLWNTFSLDFPDYICLWCPSWNICYLHFLYSGPTVGVCQVWGQDGQDPILLIQCTFQKLSNFIV